VTCPSAKLCVAFDSTGNVTASTNAAGAFSWKLAKIDSDYSLSVACSPAGLCIATDPRGNALTSANPAAGRSAWQSAHVDTN
jgi:hypothetical protein